MPVLPKPIATEDEGGTADFIAIDAEILDHQPSVQAVQDSVAPKRRGRPPGSKNRSTLERQAKNSSLEKQIGGFLVTINAPLMMIPALQRDALDPVEIEALAKAIDQECQQNARFRKYVETALKGMGATNLVGVVALVMARRAVRHNVIPINPESIPGGAETIDALMGQGIAMMAGKGPFTPGLAVVG